MSEALIDRLVADLTPVASRAMERRLAGFLAIGLALTIVGVIFILDVLMGRPFGAAWGDPMFWVKIGYSAAFGLLGLAAVPVLVRPEGRIVWPMAFAALLVLLALGVGGILWMREDFSMPMLMGATALWCPWLILMTSLPILIAVLAGMRPLAPSSPAAAGLGAGLVAGGLGAAIYAVYCAETGMLFMAVWYSTGIALTTVVGMLVGRWLLRW